MNSTTRIKIFAIAIAIILTGRINKSTAQQSAIAPVQIQMSPPVVVNFQELANYELTHPPKKKKRFIEQGEDREKNGIFIPQPVAPGAYYFNIHPPVAPSGGAPTISNAPVISFNGTLDNGTLIPPDIRGAAGPSFIMESTNQEFKIYTKAGVLNSTLSINTFFNGSGGVANGYFDPHIIYDSNNGRFVMCIDGNLSNNHGAILLAVSQTNNPTGLWWLYNVDATGNTTDFMDYPLLGINTNWVVATGRNFTSAGPVKPTIFVWNRATVYAGTAASATKFVDPTNSIVLAPAHTYDNSQTTEYLVCNWNGNSGGSGFVRLSTITGTASAPVYTTGSTLGVASPWNDNANITVGASQSGTSTKIESGDSRIGNAVFINGSLWFSHTAYLPATSSTRSAVDWWQVNPVGPVVQQFGRIDSAVTNGYNYYSSIAVNAAGDALIGYCHSSSAMFASAAYSFHAETDAASTTQSMYIYKNGLASYNKTFGSGRNRYGDYTGMGLDPSDNSFWNFSEWAQTGNNWGTVIANVAASTVSTLSSVSTSAISPTSFCTGASVNVPYTINAAANAGNVFTAQLSNSAGSFASPVAIGTLTTTAAGTIAATIPAGTATGTGYRIRVVSSSPIVTGSDNGTNITVNAKPVPSVTGSTSFCAGSSTTLNAGAGFSLYNWSTGATTQTISANTAAIFTVTVTNANGCTGTASATTTVNGNPTTSVTGTTSFCTGSSTTLDAGAGFSNYNWSTGATTQTINVNTAGTFTVTVTNANGCTGSSSATTTVNANPTTSITGSTSFCAGSSTTLNAGVGFSSYNWSTGATTQTISANTAGTFTVTIANANGCTGTASATTAVNSNPTTSVTGSTSFCAGSSTTLNAGAGFSLYNWSTGATTQTINATTAGTFTVTVTNGNGCTGSASAATTVNPLPTVSFSGLAASYAVTVSAATLTGSPVGGTFSGPGISGNTFTPSVAGVGGPYTITYSYTDGNGCSNSSSQQTTVTNCVVTATPGSITSIGGTAKMCPGDTKSYKITAVSGATSYTWTPPTGATITTGQGTVQITVNYTAAFTASGPLSVVANNACGSSPARTLTISRNNPTTPGVITGLTAGVCNSTGVPYSVVNVAGITYNWYFNVTTANVVSGQGTNAVTADYSSAYTTGTLNVTGSNACGTSAVRAISIKSAPATAAAITGATSVCANQFGVPYSISPIASATTYTWTGMTGSHISDGVVTSIGTVLTTTSTSVTVNFGNTSGKLNVKANNTCGAGVNKSLTITFNCRDINDESSEDVFNVYIYPNPVHEQLNVSFDSNVNSAYSIQVIDLMGKVILQSIGISEVGENNYQLTNDKIAKGMYFIKVTNGERKNISRVTVN